MYIILHIIATKYIFVTYKSTDSNNKNVVKCNQQNHQKN